MATKSAVAKEDPTRRSLKFFLRQSSAVFVAMARVSVPVSFSKPSMFGAVPLP